MPFNPDKIIQMTALSIRIRYILLRFMELVFILQTLSTCRDKHV